MTDVALQEMLVDAMARRRCPVCSVLDEMVFTELSRLQREAVVDPETHADVVARGGYCADHFWYLDALASPVANAELLAPLIDGVTERMATLATDFAGNASVLRQGAAQLATRLGTPVSCRVCDRMAIWQTGAVDALLVIIADPEHTNHDAQSSGPCLRHLAQALSACPDQALAAELLQVAVQQSRQLAADLRTYVRKWKEKDRRGGPEEAAPRCAIEKLVGPNRRTLNR